MINFAHIRLASPFILTLFFAFVCTSGVQAMMQGEQKLDFRVFLEDREIGYHRIEVRRNSAVTEVSVEASFDIKVLFFNAFSYRHSAEERWNGACLKAVSSDTDYGGDRLFIRSEAADTGLKIITQENEVTLAGCVSSYAYWDLDRLRASRLLNTQTGEYQQAEVTDLGIKPIQVGGISVLANCYQLQTEEGTITLWYGNDKQWLALQTRVKGDRVLSYINEAVDVDA